MYWIAKNRRGRRDGRVSLKVTRSTNGQESFHLALGSERGTLHIGRAVRLPLEERTARRKGGGVGREKKNSHVNGIKSRS
ncbi:hypothetical protein TNCV_5116451 [Trichonephila clavipes]|nr:hypothetical protein TNCV_5116451 [Trichonephila clavipes]